MFPGNLFPYPSQVIPWIDLPIETLFLESSPRTWKKDLKVQVLVTLYEEE
jgi:hypothetical protein